MKKKRKKNQSNKEDNTSGPKEEEKENIDEIKTIMYQDLQNFSTLDLASGSTVGELTVHSG